MNRVGTFEPGAPAPARTRPVERLRGKWGMWLFIATEAMLFAMLFFAYAYLVSRYAQWPPGEPPELVLPLILLAILLASSGVVRWGERGIARGDQARLRAGLGGAIILGLAFLVVQWFEYARHLEQVRPTQNSYGSIFYTITSFHLAHVLVGMGILVYLLLRAFAGHFSRERHLAVSNGALYWHFVDLIWVFVVAILYLSPRLLR